MRNPLRIVLDYIEKRAVSYWSDKLSWGGLISPGQMSNAGVLVTPDRALSLCAYYAAINRISTDVASLPVRVYRRKKNGAREEVADHPVSQLLCHSPDGESTSMRWRQSLMGHILGWGNGYAEIQFDGGGYPVGLYLLDPATTAPDRRPQDKKLFYRLGYNDSIKNAPTLPPNRVLHCAGFGFDGLKGYSVANYHREAIGLGMAAERFGGAFFGNGSRPGGVIELPYKLADKTAVERLKNAWYTEYGGPENAGKVAVLEQGAKFNPSTIPPDDAQFLQTRQFQVVEIARLFGIPPHKLGDYSQTGSAYRALEESNLDYLITTIRPWCESLEQEFARKLLTEDERKAGFYIEHRMDAFLRGNMQARADFYAKLFGLGALSIDDILSRESMNPLGGDEGSARFVATTYQTLANAMAAPEPKAAGPNTTAPDPLEGEDDDAEK